MKKITQKSNQNLVQNTQISASSYQKILGEIKNEISQTQQNIFNNLTRAKVEMAWKIGQIIEKSLLEQGLENYGRNLVQNIARDLQVSESNLYKMRNFYKTYKKIPSNNPNLNWSHYRILSGVKQPDARKYLENLVKENAWDSNLLQQEINQNNLENSKALESEKSVKKPVTKIPLKEIKATRGQLFNYKISKISGVNKLFFDCGFGVFCEAKIAVPRACKKAGAIVVLTKNGEEYLVEKSTTNSTKIHTYKAFLERVIDGDTIRVNIDLGMGIFHREILRLAKINAVEIKTNEGKKAARELTKILSGLEFLIVKTFQTDIYGRFIADVFLPKNSKQTDPQIVASQGIYLNQLLLEQGLATNFN